LRGDNERLPEPTRDPERLKQDVDAFGYCVYERALEGDVLAKLRARLLAQATAELEMGIAVEDGGGANQRLFMLINKGQVFRDVVLHEGTSDIVAHILGREFQLSTLSANIAKPGGVAMDLHTDQWWMPAPSRPEDPPVRPGNITRLDFDRDEDAAEIVQISPPVACNVMYMLNDFTAHNGGTRLVPRSHLTGRQPTESLGLKPIAAEGPAGTAVIFEGRTWHGTGANVCDRLRLGLLATFCGPQYRTQENYTLGILPEVFDQCSDELKRRLGFAVWNAYGRVGSPARAFADPCAEPLGELEPKHPVNMKL
jgi:ectoine hydroxylase-related dioxygenase (phytanoyl-CoA dioxygenase family)